MSATFLPDEQRSPAWYAARLGRLTGSSAHDMLATIKSGEAAARRNLRVRLVLERLTGVSQDDTFQTRDMARGIELEPAAIAAYEAETGEFVRRVGFLQHHALMAGCSLDGLVAGGGILEIKCPRSANHLEYLRGEVPLEYVHQCQHNLWLSGADWCDFVSYDPRFPAGLQLKITRLTMTDQQRRAYELLVRLFLTEVDKELVDVQQLLQHAEEGTAA